MEAVAQALLDWYSTAERPLPWRGPFPRDPYRALVAEVMLQQTQVDRVVEPYRRFLARFPNLEALAGASEAEVTRAFDGLGYYRRARLLHATARAVLAAGDWPTTRAGLAALPGIGDYTSAALAAFAFRGAEPPVDGNVERVTARLRGLRLHLASARLRGEAKALAGALFASAATPAVWEALMELGARVCTPLAPRCAECPLSRHCAFGRVGAAPDVPLPRRQRAAESQRWVALWVTRPDGRALLRRVPEGPILAGLWLPPFSVLRDGAEPAEIAALLMRPPLRAGDLEPVGTVRHAITHRRITVELFAHRLGPRTAEPVADEMWAEPEDPGVPTSTLLGKLRHAAAERPPAGRRRAPSEG